MLSIYIQSFVIFINIIYIKLAEAKASLNEAQINLKAWNMELNYSKQSLAQKEKTVRVKDATQSKNQLQHDKLLKEVERIKQQLARFDYEDGSFERLKEQRDTLNIEIQQKKRQLDQHNASHYQLHYQDPEPGFDRSKVRGMVGKLFTVRDEKYCLALLMAGGGSVSLTYH